MYIYYNFSDFKYLDVYIKYVLIIESIICIYYLVNLVKCKVLILVEVMINFVIN